LEQIAAFTNLRELYLNHTRFTDKGLLSLKPLQKLERIEMFRTRAGNPGMEGLRELKNLAWSSWIILRWMIAAWNLCATFPPARVEPDPRGNR